MYVYNVLGTCMYYFESMSYVSCVHQHPLLIMFLSFIYLHIQAVYCLIQMHMVYYLYRLCHGVAFFPCAMQLTLIYVGIGR